MMAGNLHVMDNPEANHIEALKNRMGRRVDFKEMSGFMFGYMAMNQERKNFQDVRVRRAFDHAKNKKAIIE